MAVYDLEEQEQLEDLKAWWKQWGNTIAGVVIAVCAGVIAVQGWRWWSAQQAEKASVLYNAVSDRGALERRRPRRRTRWSSSPTSTAAPATRRVRR